MRVGELCAGYGGIGLGLALAGEQIHVSWIAEVDEKVSAIWDGTGIDNLGDITKIDWTQVEPVDLLTAGFPCQPVSAAGAQLAEADPRWLWPAVRDAIAALLPDRVLLENVRNLVSMRKGEIWAYILDDLTGLGYDVTWLTLGACAVGAAHHRHRVFALATLTTSPHGQMVTRLDVAECGAPRGAVMVPTATSTDAKDSRNETAQRSPGQEHHSSGTTLGDFARIVGTLLPTPMARDADGRGEGDAAYWAARIARKGAATGRPLGAEVAALFPTPTSGDHAGAGYSTVHGMNLRTAVSLLPTPRASDGVNGGPGQRGSSGDLALPSATQPQHWGRFADAVARHASLFGQPPPPTEPNRNGAPRLSAAFAEWLMCIPPGHVTDVLPRREALKAIGNGVCPPQLAAAWRALIDTPNDISIESGAMTSTSAEVKEIQDRNATARGRVIAAAGLQTNGGNHPDSLAEVVQAAMMELAEVWREEAAWFTAQKRKGHIGISKELTQAAARLAGFAVGLTTRPVTTELKPNALRCDCGAWITLPPTGEAVLCGCGLLHRADLDSELPAPGPGQLIDMIDAVIEALPEGDPVVNVFTSPSTAPLDDPNPEPTLPSQDSRDLHEIGHGPSEEQNLRAIIGPLGAASIVDSPFTNPGVPWLNQKRAVEVVPFHELPIIAAATPARDHVSHSYVETYEGCSLSAMLRDASRAGQIGAQRPGWSQIGGRAFHSAVEMIERMALSNVMVADDIESFWLQAFEAEVKETMDALVGTPYADSTTWYIANKGKEGFDWWRVEGAKMLQLYVKHHTPEWRAANATFLLQDQTPVIELEYNMSLRSLDGERGLTAKGFVDKATLDMSTYSLTVLDYKTSSRDPGSTFQLGEYGHALLMAMGIANEPPERPILGRYWLARKGIYTDPVAVVTRHPLTELQYRYDVADRGTRQRIFAPHVTNLCTSCSVVDYCPAQAGRS